jgi:ribonuclease P protein component
MRLVRGSDFERVFKQGGRARGSILLVVVRPSELAHSRLGLSIGRSIWKSAVRRNRIRRVFREAFRLAYPALPRGVDIVLVAAQPKLVPDTASTQAELLTLAHKALRKFRARTEPLPREGGGA